MASDFPTKEDVALWDKYDATYGMDAAGSLRPGAPNPKISMDRLQELELLYGMSNNDEDRARVRKMMEAEAEAGRTPMDDRARELMMRNYIASRRSGVASLGFEPSRSVLTEKKEDMSPYSRTLGFMLGGGDYTYTKDDPRTSGSTMTHEGIHRGIDQLIAAKDQEAQDLYEKAEDYRQILEGRGKKVTKEEKNKLERLQADALKARNDQQKLLGINADVSEKAHDENETVTRALMYKNYGRVERQGEVKSDEGLYLKGLAYTFDNPDFLNQLEQMATEELKRRGRPMGPR